MVVTEHLAVVRGKEQQGAVEQALAVHIFAEAAYLRVQKGQVGVIGGAGAVDDMGREATAPGIDIERVFGFVGVVLCPVADDGIG